MTTKGKTFPVLARAFFRSCAKRSNSPATSPPRSEDDDVLVLVAIADGTELRMIAILFATARPPPSRRVGLIRVPWALVPSDLKDASPVQL
jgi:hypothetical protein